MNISQNGVDLIKKFEGCRLKAYKPVPTEKYWTIGYGHYGPDVKENETITQQEAENQLKKDLEHYVHEIVVCLKVQVNQNQFDALISFAYNLGIGTLQKSDLLQFINHSDFKNAANEFEKFVHAGGKVLQGLVTRRNAEKELFLKPVPVKNPVVTTPKIKETFYTVIKGDTVSEIADKFKSTIKQIKDWNKLDNDYTLKVGQKLRVK